MLDGDPRRLQIEAELDVHIRDDAWSYIVAQGKADAYLRGELPPDALRRDILALHRSFASKVPRIGDGIQGDAPPFLSADSPTAQEYTVREEALSRVVAEYAEQDSQVRAFRGDPDDLHGLNGRTLGWWDVEQWMQAQQRIREWSYAELRPPWVLDGVVVRSDHARLIEEFVSGSQDETHAGSDASEKTLDILMTRAEVRERWEHGAVRREVVKYCVPEDTIFRSALVPRNSTLERLWSVTRHVVRRFPVWHEAAASVFVLTDEVPLIRRLTYAEQTNEGMPSLSRIVLTVDPTLSPRELADQFRDIRLAVLGERHRELSDKHAHLALFSVTQLRDQPLAARMAEWNRQHPEWLYTRDSAFSWDMLQAQRRTVGTVLSSASGARKEKQRHPGGEGQARE